MAGLSKSRASCHTSMVTYLSRTIFKVHTTSCAAVWSNKICNEGQPTDLPPPLYRVRDPFHDHEAGIICPPKTMRTTIASGNLVENHCYGPATSCMQRAHPSSTPIRSILNWTQASLTRPTSAMSILSKELGEAADGATADSRTIRGCVNDRRGWTILEEKVPLVKMAPRNAALMRHWIIEILGWRDFSNDYSLNSMQSPGITSKIEFIWASIEP